VSTALKRFLAGTALAAMAFTASPAHAQTRSVSPPGDPSFPPAGQWVQIESDSSGLCLAARDGAGGAVVLDDCAPRAGQYWSVSYHADGSSRVHNRATGMCLDVDGKPAQPNEGAVQRPCGIYGDPDSANQWWNLYRFGAGRPGRGDEHLPGAGAEVEGPRRPRPGFSIGARAHTARVATAPRAE
jgi:hypothetical protein